MKIKCDTCGHYHGGFHLCVGADADPRLKKDDRVYGTYEPGKISPEHLEKLERGRAASTAGVKGRWARRHEQTRERDEDILAMYAAGNSLATVGAAHGLAHPTIKAIVERMGGTLRPRGKNLSSRKKN